MDLKDFVALSGWALALIQFGFTYRESKKKNEAELLEKTLSYFERGTQARSIAISLVEGIWVKRKKNLDVFAPVVISQIIFLLTSAENFAQEERNLIRLLYLAEKCIPHSINPNHEWAEISEALIESARNPGKLSLSKTTLRHWYAKFNASDTETFDAEVGF